MFQGRDVEKRLLVLRLAGLKLEEAAPSHMAPEVEMMSTNGGRFDPPQESAALVPRTFPCWRSCGGKKEKWVHHILSW